MNYNQFILFLKQLNGVGDSFIRKLIVNGCFAGLELSSKEETLAWLKQHAIYSTKKSTIQNLTIEDIQQAKANRITQENLMSVYNVGYITYFDERYPKRFKDMRFSKGGDFPVILYYQGNIDLLNEEKICSVIGTRKPDEEAIKYGEQITKKMVDDGYVILSGLAEGCDSLGHKTCLDNNGKTIAIVGTGLDTIFPKKNEPLAKEILEKDGLIISEYPLGFKGASYSFVQRDRLQAAGADITIVIQTTDTGGTMHASKDSITKYNKKLWVISPELLNNKNCSGNKELISFFGAKEIKEI